MTFVGYTENTEEVRDKLRAMIEKHKKTLAYHEQERDNAKKRFEEYSMNVEHVNEVIKYMESDLAELEDTKED